MHSRWRTICTSTKHKRQFLGLSKKLEEHLGEWEQFIAGERGNVVSWKDIEEGTIVKRGKQPACERGRAGYICVNEYDITLRTTDREAKYANDHGQSTREEQEYCETLELAICAALKREYLRRMERIAKKTFTDVKKQSHTGSRYFPK